MKSLTMMMPGDQYDSIERILRRHGFKDMQDFFDECIQKVVGKKVGRFDYFPDTFK